MSNVLKSKSFLGVAIVAVLAVVAFSFAASALAYTHTVTLKMGSTGAQVQSLQMALNAAGFTVSTSGAGSPGMESTYFGAKTKAAVMSFQASKGLTADGVVGPMTGAALGLVVAGPAGNPNQPGCPAGAVYNYLTGAPCSGNGNGNGNGGLQGGAGDLDLSSTTTDVEDTVKEGEEDVKIFGVKAEADGSDIAITSVKLAFKNCDGGSCGAASTSENFEKYIDEVTVWLDDKQVGSADAEDFSKESGSPDEYTKTISLNGAIIDEDDDAKLYVAVTAVDNIDSDDLAADWEVNLETMRFTDATGAILSADVDAFDGDGENDAFTFEDEATDDAIDLKSSSANPDDDNIEVDEDTSTDDVLALAFKLDVDEDSADVDITSMSFDVDLSSSVTSSVEDVIDSLVVKIGGNEYEADLDTDSGTDDNDADTGTSTYVVDIDSGDLTIGSGDVEEGKVYLTFNDQDGNYDEGATVVVSLADEDIEAETENDEISDVGGSDQTGATLTLTLSGSTVEVTDTSHSQNDSGTIGTFTFEVTITAEEEDVDVDAAAILETLLGGSDTSYTTLTIINTDDDAVENVAGSDYTVSEGDTAEFSITYTHDPDSAGSYYVRLDSIDGITVDETVGPETLAAS